MDIQQPKPIDRAIVEPVDVLIVTAAAAEDNAVLAVDEGGLDAWQETPGPPGFGFVVWRRWYRAAEGGRLSMALCRAHEMGGDSTANAAARLVDAYQPRCLAMCGVCAGDPRKTQLGDVIIADRVYRYDVGEIVRTGGDTQSEFHADTMPYPFHPQWKQAAEKLVVPSSAAWLAERPRTRAMQADWVLKELLDERNPLESPDRCRFCADWTEVVGQLQRNKLIRLKGGRPQLTVRGRNRIQQTLFDHCGQLPAQAPWQIHVGPLGTGNNLVRDVGIWDRLGQAQRHIAGLDMEGSVIGFTAHLQSVHRFIVAKGVMDYGEVGRGQGFRTFAARAAAEVLLSFVRRHLPPEPRRTPAEILKPNTALRPGAASPATLLNARYQIVFFFAALRQMELELLDAWCQEEGGVGVRLLIGPGGTGKTRLLIHWSQKLREAPSGWYAGFLPERVTSEDLDTLMAADRPTLIVVDYAESRPGLLELLRRLVSRPSEGRVSCRVVLLARDVGDWWLALRQQDTAVADLLDRYEPLRLTPVPLLGSLRQRAFEQARECFARFHAESQSALDGGLGCRENFAADLSDDRFGRVLYLHAAALAAVMREVKTSSNRDDGGLSAFPCSPDRLLDDVLEHEGRFWLWQYPQHYPDDLLDRAEFVAGMRRVVAVATLLGGLPSREAVELLSQRVRGPEVKHLPRFLHWLYPGRSDAGPQAAWVSGLEPDLLGETLVARVLADADTPDGYLERVFASSGTTSLHNGFVVLGRIALWDEARGTAWLAGFLNGDIPGRARTAFDAALTLGRHTALASLGQVLAAALARNGTVELAAQLEPLVPWQTVSLREVGLWAVRALVDRLPLRTEDQAALVERARLLIRLDKRLGDVGRLEEAVTAIEEAVQIRRTLAAADPDAFLPKLALSLATLGVSLGELGHREKALQAIAEAVEILRRLASQRPAAFLPNLAQSLNNLGAIQSKLGRREDALQATAESVEILRRLGTQHPDTFLSDLATSLHNLGMMYSNLGRREEALQATTEAVEIRRRLASQRPDAFLPDLATSLSNLGLVQGNLGRLEDAQQATAEAVEIFRRLGAQRPDAFLSDLATSLNNLGVCLSDTGRRDEALQATAEAVRLTLPLAKRYPGAFVDQLRTSLHHLRQQLAALDRDSDADPLVCQAIALLSQLGARADGSVQ